MVTHYGKMRTGYVTSPCNLMDSHVNTMTGWHVYEHSCTVQHTHPASGGRNALPRVYLSKGVDQNFTTFLHQHADLEGYQLLIM
jgi:hypothetical protein